MSDVLALLPPFEWRGRKYPVTARNVSFAHESADHVLQYRDNAIVEQTGAKNPTFSYTIPMRQDLAAGPYKDLFTEGLVVLFRDMRLRDHGPLVDPVYGNFTCVPTSYSDDTDVNKRDGTDVRVEFKLSPELDEDEQLQPPTLNGILADAERLDGEIKRANWQQEPSPEGTTDILSAINGALSVPGRLRDKATGGVNDLAFRMEKIEDTIDRTTDPKNWTLRAEARRFRYDAVRFSVFGETPAEPRKTRKTTFPQPLSAVAASMGLSLDQLLLLNPQLASSPIVPAGTAIRVPARV